jgi:hypothetical protein
MKLSEKERNENAIEAGLQLIPAVGGALATLYFGRKQEIRFKRLEQFYSQISDELKKIQDKFPPVERHDEESLLSILEKLNDRIEKESINEKVSYLKKYLRNTLLQPVTKENLDSRLMFLNIVSELTVFECNILCRINMVKADNATSARHISKKIKCDEYVAAGAINKLRALGFLRREHNDMIVHNVDPILSDSFTVSDFGKEFIQFCMQQD